MLFFFFLYVNVYFQGLVCAGLADMARPAEKLSTAQSAVLMATGKLNEYFLTGYSIVLFYSNLLNCLVFEIHIHTQRN